MDEPLDVEVVVRWLTFLPIVVCSVFGLAITLAKWRQLRRPVLPDNSTLGMLRRSRGARDESYVRVTVTRHGRLYVAAVTLAELRDVLTTLAAARDPRVLLEADARAEHGRVVA